MKDVKIILENLEKLNKILPEIAVATADNKCWSSLFPYTIEDAIEYLKEQIYTTCNCDDPSCPQKGIEGELSGHIEECSCAECHRHYGKISS